MASTLSIVAVVPINEIRLLEDILLLIPRKFSQLRKEVSGKYARDVQEVRHNLEHVLAPPRSESPFFPQISTTSPENTRSFGIVPTAMLAKHLPSTVVEDAVLDVQQMMGDVAVVVKVLVHDVEVSDAELHALASLKGKWLLYTRPMPTQVSTSGFLIASWHRSTSAHDFLIQPFRSKNS